MPTFRDTAGAIGVTAIVMIPLQLVTFYVITADMTNVRIVAPLMAAVPPLVFVLSLTRRTLRRARSVAGTGAAAGALGHDLAYAAAFGCLVPAMMVPMLLSYTSITASVAAPILVGVALAAGVAMLLVRRRQRPSRRRSA